MSHHPLTKQMLMGMRILCLMQLFSMLSFGVLYSTLALYMTSYLKLSASFAINITGSFVALNYFLHLLGGYIGGRLLSYRLLFCLGMLFQTAGCIILASTSLNSLFWGLAPFLVGCGLNITCINCMLTELFKPEDKNRETAFFWNYSSMNIGFLIGFTLSGFFQLHEIYSSLFLSAGGSNLIALILLAFYWGPLKDSGTHLAHTPSQKRLQLGILGVLLLIGLAWTLYFLLRHSSFSNDLIMIVGFTMLVLIIILAIKQRVKEASRKIWAYFILILASLTFSTLYQMGPMGLILFITHNVNREIFHFTIPPQWLLNINTLIIILGGPSMAYLYKKLRMKGFVIRIPLQFALALFFIGAAYALLPLGITLASPEGKTALIWVIFAYILLSLGELFISPIGYAMIGQLIPTKLQGLMMGIWLMTTGVAATFSKAFSQLGFQKSQLQHPLLTNTTFSHTFSLLGWSAIGAGIIISCLIPFLQKLIQEKTSKKNMTPHPYNDPE